MAAPIPLLQVPLPVLRPEPGWTYRIDSDKKREHDFRNLLQEYTMAVQREDKELMAHLARELTRIYLDSRCASPLPGGIARCKGKPKK